MHGEGGVMGLGGGFMWLFWILLIVLAVWAVRAMTSNTNQAGRRGGTALEILEERYARGEIDREEYEEKRRDLINH
ncbi:MAG: SHOCT domain-containing protein [Gammaproteobacteria bacterium]|nr:SHOCT domain-containing protein [Gammaproteobacteria bacterium]